jgi:hypothetical protein
VTGCDVGLRCQENYGRDGAAREATGNLLRAHETGAFHSRSIENRIAAEKKTRTTRFLRMVPLSHTRH